MKKNDVVEVEISDISFDGQGIGRTSEGIVVFVQNALIGEVVNVHILKVLKNVCFGKIVEFIKTSPSRIDSMCKIFEKCGGCSYQHTDYENELILKTKNVKTALKSIGGIDFDVSDAIGSENYLNYRNKMLMPVGYDKQGKLSAGFYRARTHTIIPCKNCLIANSDFSVIIDTILKFMIDFEIQPYDEVKHNGVVRHIYIRKGEYSGEIMVGLVTNSKRLKNGNFLIESLLALNLNIVSVIQNINTEKNNVILGKRTNVLHGKSAISDSINGIEFLISAPSFYQVNTKQAEVLYSEAMKHLDEENDIIFDLYSGIGTITLNLAKKAKKVYGIESNQTAVEDANKNKEINNITNVEFICDLAEEAMPKLIGEGITPSTIVLDPPRSGCHKGLIESILKVMPKKIIYISCNPATLARDVKMLTESKYSLKSVQPVDLFARTSHVETVCLLTKNED